MQSAARWTHAEESGSTDLSAPPAPSALEEIRRGIVNVAVPHNEPPSVIRRRRIVVAIVLVLGAAALSFALRKHPGEAIFLLVVAGAGGRVGARRVHIRTAAPRRRPLARPQPAPSGQRHHRSDLLLGGIFVARRVDRPPDPGRRRAHHSAAAVHRPGFVAADHGRRAAGRDRRRDVLPRRAVHRARADTTRC